MAPFSTKDVGLHPRLQAGMCQHTIRILNHAAPGNRMMAVDHVFDAAATVPIVTHPISATTTTAIDLIVAHDDELG